MRHCIVTGASKGLGLEILRALTGAGGYRVEDWSRTTGVDLKSNHCRYPACDVLILNAGSWETDFPLNYEAPKSLALQFIGHHRTKKTKGHLIFILSNAAYKNYGNDDYTTQKAGLLLLARRLWEEGRKIGVKVSTISPGTIDGTNFWDGAETDNRARGAMPVEEVASLVRAVVLAGENGACVTELQVMPELREIPNGL